MEKNCLTDKYDETEYYKEKMKPLVDQLFELANDRGLPFMACTCTMNSEDTHALARSVCMTGPQRSPVEMVLISEILDADSPMGVVMACMRAPAIVNAAMNSFIGDDE